MRRSSKKTKCVISATEPALDHPLAPPAAGPGGQMEIVFSFDTTGSMNGCIAEVSTGFVTYSN